MVENVSRDHVQLSADEAAEFQAAAERIAGAVNGFMQGKADVVRLALLCLLAEGHRPGLRTCPASGRPRLRDAWREPCIPGSGFSSLQIFSLVT